MMSYAFTLLAVHCGCLGKSKFFSWSFESDKISFRYVLFGCHQLTDLGDVQEMWLSIIFLCANLQLESWTKFKKMRNFWQTKIRKICRKYATFWRENPHCVSVWSCSRMSEPSEPLVKLSKTTEGKQLCLSTTTISHIFSTTNDSFQNVALFLLKHTWFIHIYPPDQATVQEGFFWKPLEKNLFQTFYQPLKGLKKVFVKLFWNRSRKYVPQTILERFNKTYTCKVATRLFKIVSETYIIKLSKNLLFWMVLNWFSKNCLETVQKNTFLKPSWNDLIKPIHVRFLKGFSELF